MQLQRMLKPATVTSIGFIIVAVSNIFPELTPPYLVKIGWALVGLGTVWFFMKK